MFGLEKKLAKTAKRVGFLSGGLMLCVVGAAFLTAAAWLLLAPVYGPAMAALIIGGAYLGLGLILVGVSGSDQSASTAAPEASKPPKAPADSAGPPLMQAFLYGMSVGAKAGQKSS